MSGATASWSRKTPTVITVYVTELEEKRLVVDLRVVSHAHI